MLFKPEYNERKSEGIISSSERYQQKMLKPYDSLSKSRIKDLFYECNVDDSGKSHDEILAAVDGNFPKDDKVKFFSKFLFIVTAILASLFFLATSPFWKVSVMFLGFVFIAVIYPFLYTVTRSIKKDAYGFYVHLKIAGLDKVYESCDNGEMYRTDNKIISESLFKTRFMHPLMPVYAKQPARDRYSSYSQLGPNVKYNIHDPSINHFTKKFPVAYKKYLHIVKLYEQEGLFGSTKRGKINIENGDEQTYVERLTKLASY